jgi:hypothetical protein
MRERWPALIGICSASARRDEACVSRRSALMRSPPGVRGRPRLTLAPHALVHLLFLSRSDWLRLRLHVIEVDGVQVRGADQAHCVLDGDLGDQSGGVDAAVGFLGGGVDAAEQSGDVGAARIGRVGAACEL